MTPFGKQLHEQLQSLYAPKPQLYAGDYGRGQGSSENTIQGPDERPVSPAPQASQPSSIVSAAQSIAPAPAKKKIGKVNESGFKPPPAPKPVLTEAQMQADWQNHPALYASNPNPPPAAIAPAPAPAPALAPAPVAPAPAPAPVAPAFDPAAFKFDPSTLDWGSIMRNLY